MTAIHTTWQAWQTALAAVPPELACASRAQAAWNVRDVVAHILWYEREMVNLLRTQRFTGSEWWYLPLEERNARIQGVFASQEYASLLELTRQTHAELISLLDGLPPAALQDPAAFPGMPGEWQPWQVIADNTCAHYPEHTAQVSAILAALEGSA
ncbi:MAG: hypothetical protein Fur0018_19480 [Anaerolineales bacterium]